jgi:YgiT-type zinc finger domain-containing protein
MGKEDFDREWAKLSAEVIAGMKEWRLQHPKATFREIEAALDQRLNQLRARMLQDSAEASAAAQWDEAPEEERPKCPECGSVLHVRGQKERHMQTQGGAEIILKRSYGVCPTCGAAFFPPRRRT